MSKVLFRAGYYEWNVFIGDDCIYSFGDVGEDITEDTTYTELEYFVDDCIYCMQEDLEDKGREQLEEKYIPELKKQMLEQWGYHFGIEQ